MSQVPITVVDYSPEWPEKYAAEERRIHVAVGDYVSAVEHIGSTAVPGLAAKPIVDIMVGVETLADAEACIEPLEALGYEYCPQFEDAMPERRYFRKTESGERTHHLHMVEQDTEFWERHLLFRDYLRENEAIAREYETLKREVAAAHTRDIDAYTEAKSSFIEEVVDRARVADDRR